MMMEGYDGGADLAQQQLFVNLFHQERQVQKTNHLRNIPQGFVGDDEGGELEQHIE